MSGTAIHGAPGAAPTLPQLLLGHAARRGARVAMREKHRGIWREWRWQEVARESRALAHGLQAEGLRRGERLLIVGDNRPRLLWSIAAAQMLGAVPVLVPGETPAGALTRIVAAEAVRHAVASDARLAERLDSAVPDAHGLRIIVDDPRGTHLGQANGIVELDQLLTAGRAADTAQPAALDREIAAGGADDTSARLPCAHVTLGSPDEAWNTLAGCAPTHAQAVAAASAHIGAHRIGEHDDLLAHLPFGSHADHHFCVALAWTAGLTVNFPESTETVPIDIREIGPTLHVLPDWALLPLRSRILRRARDANPLSRVLLRRSLGDETGSAPDGAPGLPGRWLALRPLRDLLGLHRTRVLFVEGAQAAPAGVDFFRRLEVPIAFIDGWSATLSPAPRVRTRSAHLQEAP